MGRDSRWTSRKARRLGYRSGLEVKVSEQLEKVGVTFEYESEVCKLKYYTTVSNGGLLDRLGEVIPLAKSSKIIQYHNYLCDFALTKENGSIMFVETKGRFTGKDRVKHIALKKLYPDIDLRILFQQDGKVSNKTTYSQWCEKQGIDYYCLSYAEKKKGNYVPDEWLEECI